MKVKDIKEAIEGLEREFGSNILNNDVYFDSTFGNEIMIDIGEFITTLLDVPSEDEYK